MSNGEFSRANPWADIRLKPATLMGAVAREVTAVEDAQGNIKAANERLREDIIAAQLRVESAEQALTESQESVTAALRGMDLFGRIVDFDSGASLAVIYSKRPGKDVANYREEDLAGVSGQLVDFEVGTLLGDPIQPPDAVVLHVDTTGSAGIQADRIAVVANGAQYTISAAPKPGE